MKNTAYLGLIFVVLMATGCASRQIDIPNLESSSTFIVEDLRPDAEKVDKVFSLLIGTESYGIFRRGDKWVEPNPTRFFQHKIYEKYPEANSQPDVKIHHLVVYENAGSQLSRGVIGGVLGGVIGGIIASSTAKYGVDGKASLTTVEEFNSFEKEYQRAQYTAEENPGKGSVYRVYFEAEIDGKRTFATTITPVKLPKDNTKSSHAVALETAMAFLLDQY